MYEESAGIPLIMAGPDVPRGNLCPTPVTLADGFPTFIHSLGARAHPADSDLPGHSLLDIACGAEPRRTILSEYHAAAAVCGAFMIRHGKWKYVHYVGLPPMLFDLEADPHERRDLGRETGYAAMIRECEAALRAVVDPDAADRLARADQRAMIDRHGGVDAILNKGTFRYSPPPGGESRLLLMTTGGAPDHCTEEITWKRAFAKSPTASSAFQPAFRASPRTALPSISF